MKKMIGPCRKGCFSPLLCNKGPSQCPKKGIEKGQKFAANGYTVAAVKFLIWSVVICRKEIGWVGSRNIP